MSQAPSPAARPLSPTDPSPRRRYFRLALNTLLVLASLAYIGYVVAAQWEGIRSENMHLGWGGAIGLVLMLALSIGFSTIYHVLAIRRIEASELPATRIGLAYALGQIVRYLPGKVLGIVFERNFLVGDIRLATITLALLAQTMNNYGWTGLFAGAIVACAWTKTAWPLLGLVPAAAILLVSHRQQWAERILLALPVARRVSGFEQLPPAPPPYSTLASVVLIVQWLPFLAGWYLLLDGQATLHSALVLGAVYLLASIASTAALFLPSGIIVREAIFAWLGHEIGFPIELVLLTGLLLRVALIGADLLNVVVTWLLDALHRQATHPTTEA